MTSLWMTAIYWDSIVSTCQPTTKHNKSLRINMSLVYIICICIGNYHHSIGQSPMHSDFHNLPPLRYSVSISGLRKIIGIHRHSGGIASTVHITNHIHGSQIVMKHFRVPCILYGEFTGHRSERPVTRSFDVFFDLHLNKGLSKQSRGWWFEMPSRSLWRHCNMYFIVDKYRTSLSSGLLHCHTEEYMYTNRVDSLG